VKPAVATRLYVDAPLSAKATVEIGADRAHYLGDVLRLKPEAPLRLFNGRDGEWRAALGKLAKSGGKLTVEAKVRAQDAAPDLWLVFAATKRASIDLIAEKATELGVSCLQPIVTQNTHVDRVNTDRLRAIAIEAAEQCERLTVPEVRAPVPFTRLLAEWPTSRRMLACVEAGKALPVAAALSAYAEDTTSPWAVLVGPEGGWSPSELDAIGKSPICIPVGLGPRVLRAETAALAAIACWQAILGDKDQRPALRETAR
jgi:16S rRNA (uracil1498-N3)-methyltransferase